MVAWSIEEAVHSDFVGTTNGKHGGMDGPSELVRIYKNEGVVGPSYIILCVESGLHWPLHRIQQ